jgi:predicted MFS family arabinose efflux permease
VLGTDARGYGLLLTAAGLGAVGAALRLASRRYTRREHRRNLLGGLVLFAFGVLGLSTCGRIGPALACQVVAGFGMILYTATTNTLLQLFVADGYRGRAMGLHTVMFLGTAPVGSLVLGALAERFGAPTAAAASGTVSLGAAVWLAFRLRRLAERERPAA